MMDNEMLEISYKVVVNAEEQYALWPSHQQHPDGWSNTGKIGTKEECLSYVKEVWIDLTPQSLRHA